MSVLRTQSPGAMRGAIMLLVLAAEIWGSGARGEEPPTAGAATASANETGARKGRTEPDQATLEREFAEKLSGASLIGSFTTVGQEKSELSEDKYQLELVKPLKNGFWLFQSRIQYGGRDVRLPLALEVKWAGDTPVITLTNVLVPGLGTFTARVLFYGDQYAGTWNGGDHGGHMFGRIVKEAPAERAPAEPTSATGASDAQADSP